MADETTTTTVKELYLGFAGSDGKTKRLVIAHPEDNLDATTTRAAMQKIIDANLFENKGIKLYTDKESANYMTRIKNEIFNDKKKK